MSVINDPLTIRGILIPPLSVFHTIRIGLLSLLIGLLLPLSSWADEAQALYNQALSHVQQKDFQRAGKIRVQGHGLFQMLNGFVRLI